MRVHYVLTLAAFTRAFAQYKGMKVWMNASTQASQKASSVKPVKEKKNCWCYQLKLFTYCTCHLQDREKTRSKQLKIASECCYSLFSAVIFFCLRPVTHTACILFTAYCLACSVWPVSVSAAYFSCQMSDEASEGFSQHFLGIYICECMWSSESC